MLNSTWNYYKRAQKNALNPYPNILLFTDKSVPQKYSHLYANKSCIFMVRKRSVDRDKNAFMFSMRMKAKHD